MASPAREMDSAGRQWNTEKDVRVRGVKRLPSGGTCMPQQMRYSGVCADWEQKLCVFGRLIRTVMDNVTGSERAAYSTASVTDQIHIGLKSAPPAEDRTRDLSLVSCARYHWAMTPHDYHNDFWLLFCCSCLYCRGAAIPRWDPMEATQCPSLETSKTAKSIVIFGRNKWVKWEFYPTLGTKCQLQRDYIGPQYAFCPARVKEWKCTPKDIVSTWCGGERLLFRWRGGGRLH